MSNAGPTTGWVYGYSYEVPDPIFDLPDYDEPVNYGRFAEDMPFDELRKLLTAEDGKVFEREIDNCIDRCFGDL